ncbi:hypothetical protein H9P43_001212 [Blastocladiella emersonii ATCC 22665]|nr:hypothetical protein H9P43_001212 [Blastocladiella emersonii ATCC 22665]
MNAPSIGERPAATMQPPLKRVPRFIDLMARGHPQFNFGKGAPSAKHAATPAGSGLPGDAHAHFTASGRPAGSALSRGGTPAFAHVMTPAPAEIRRPPGSGRTSSFPAPPLHLLSSAKRSLPVLDENYNDTSAPILPPAGDDPAVPPTPSAAPVPGPRASAAKRSQSKKPAPRRTSLSRRSSSMAKSKLFLVPDKSVPKEDLYKHIPDDQPPFVRFRTLLAWASQHALNHFVVKKNPKKKKGLDAVIAKSKASLPPPPPQPSEPELDSLDNDPTIAYCAADLAYEMTKLFSKSSFEDIGWPTDPTAEPDEPGPLLLRPNPTNEKIRTELAQVEFEIDMLTEEAHQWAAVLDEFQEEHRAAIESTKLAATERHAMPEAELLAALTPEEIAALELIYKPDTTAQEEAEMLQLADDIAEATDKVSALAQLARAAADRTHANEYVAAKSFEQRFAATTTNPGMSVPLLFALGQTVPTPSPSPSQPPENTLDAAPKQQ